jgi:NADH-quinone oxidoreductase subunit J
MHPEPFFFLFHFYLFGVIAVASAITFVTRRSPVAAALWLVNTMFCLAAMYVLLDAHFIGVIQVLVYAGAIMVVFLFVIMLLNLGHPSEIADTRGLGWKLAAGAVGVLMLAELLTLQKAVPVVALAVPYEYVAVQVRDQGAVGAVAAPLFAADGYLLAFELTSVVLLVAIVGAVVLGRRRDVHAG